MAKDWRLFEEFEVADLFQSNTGTDQPDVVDQPATIEEVRTRLRFEVKDISDEYWFELLGHAATKGLAFGEQLKTGSFAIVAGMSVVAAKSAQELTHEHGGNLWKVAISGRFSELLEAITSVTKEWDWNPPRTVELVGKVCETNDRSATLEVLAIRDPDSVSAFFHPTLGPIVPGREDAAEKMADVNRGALRFECATPEDLLEEVLVSLEEEDEASFGKLCTTAEEHMLRRRYLQCLYMYSKCGGKVEFSHYDDRYRPEDYPACKFVRLFVRHQLVDGGAVGQSPLLFKKEGDWWRFDRGVV